MNRQFTDETDFTEVFWNVMTEEHRTNLERRTKKLAELIVSRMPVVPPHEKFEIVDPKTVKLPKLRSPGKPLQ
jgi:hypothetical protein